MIRASLLGLLVFCSTLFAASPSPSPSPSPFTVTVDITISSDYLNLRSGFLKLPVLVSTANKIALGKVAEINRRVGEVKKEWADTVNYYGLKWLANIFPSFQFKLSYTVPPAGVVKDEDIYLAQEANLLALLKRLDQGTGGDVAIVPMGSHLIERKDYQYKNLWAVTIPMPSYSKVISLSIVFNWPKIIAKLINTASSLYVVLAEALAYILYDAVMWPDWTMNIEGSG